MQVWFANVWLSLPGERWRDITDTLPTGSPPTLAWEKGIGALQFSVGLYSGGPRPNIDTKALERLLYYFEEAQGFERISQANPWQNDRILGLSCDYSNDSQSIRVWYCTDGGNIAFITFVTGQISAEVQNQELFEADLIVRSLRFKEITPAPPSQEHAPPLQ